MLRNWSSSAGSNGVRTSNVVDLFVAAGQSNMVGQGSASLAPGAPNGLYINGSTITKLYEPVANANTGTLLPAFSNAWAVATGHKSAFVATAANGSSLVAAGTGWNPTGTLRSQAVTAANTARTAIIGSGTYTLGNVYVLWLQGEQEAITYDGTTITSATYASALGTLADYFAANITGFTKMCVIQICGTGASNVITLQDALHSAYEQIRYGNTLGVANDPTNLMMAYDGCHHFVSLAGLQDGTHMNQTSLNVTGALAAQGIASPRTPPAISPFLSSSNYNDSTVTFKASRTASHTTDASTTCLIVAVASSFVNTNATAFNTSVNFNGVPMKAAAVSQVNSASPVGASTAGIYYLDNVLYGGSLAGVTANIVVTPGNNQSMIDWCAINAKDVALVDAEGGAYPAPDAGATAIADSMWTYYPTLMVTCGASVAASATPLTCTMTNATKLLDHSLSNGSLSAQSVVGYSSESAAVVGKTITATWSASCTHRALVSVAFRARIAGE